MFFDVRFDRHEMVVDEIRYRAIAVRLGFQPSAGASRRRCTEIEEQRPVLLFRVSERLIHISDPIHQHVYLLVSLAATAQRH